MPLRNQKPRRWVPAGLTDAVDGGESFPGAMALLTNLIAQPNTKGIMVARPAMTQLTAIPDFGGGPVTAEVSYGNTVYGMAASATFAGKDRPFDYNATANTFATISGLSSALLPASQPTTGDWTPPTIAYVASRVVFTHPGFPGGTTVPPTFIQFAANRVNGSATLTGPYAFFAVPGLTLFESGLPANTTLFSSIPLSVFTTATGTAGTNTITVGSATGLVIGMACFGPGIAGIVINIAGTTITLNNNIAMNITAASVEFQGTQLFISAAATATGNGVIVYGASSAAIKFGWLDISGFSVSGIAGNTLIGVPVITGAPSLIGFQPGMTVTDTGGAIPAGTQIVQSMNVTFSAGAVVTINTQTITLTTGFTSSGISVGQTISGVGIPPGTTVLAVTPPGYSITMSNFATASSLSGTLITFSGAFVILSKAATATVTQDNFSVAGGTAAAPLWGAGDLNINPIGSNTPPVFVAQFNNRAWFGVNTPQTSGVQASDSGAACNQTNISQTLTFFDGVPVTAASGLALFNQLGGIVQSLMVFQGDSNIRQITGDFATTNISVNSLQTATGTLSPNSIEPTPKGLLFAASDGLRLIDFDARVSDPIGVRGQGLVLPFINAVTPSRMEASFNENVYRITLIWQPPIAVQNIWGTAQRTDEFWFHLDLGKWSGPHTSLCDNLAPWPGASSFVTAPMAARGFLYRSDPEPSISSVYTEAGTPLSCVARTALLPDNPEGMAHMVVESTVFIGLTSGSQELLATSTEDDSGQTLDQAYAWIGPFSTPAHRPILWHKPLIFRQMSMSFQMAASSSLQIGAIMIRDQELGYQYAYPVPVEFVLGQSILGGSDVLGP